MASLTVVAADGYPTPDAMRVSCDFSVDTAGTYYLSFDWYNLNESTSSPSFSDTGNAVTLEAGESRRGWLKTTSESLPHGASCKVWVYLWKDGSATAVAKTSLSFTIPYPPEGSISSFSASVNNTTVTLSISFSGMNYSASEYAWNYYVYNSSGVQAASGSIVATTRSKALTLTTPGAYTVYAELYYTTGNDVHLSTSTTRSFTISYGKISSLSVSDGGGKINATFSFSGLGSNTDGYKWYFYYRYGDSGTTYNTSGSSNTTSVSISVSTAGNWTCWLDLYYTPYSTTERISYSGVKIVYIDIPERPNNWTWATTIDVGGRSFSRVIASGQSVPTLQRATTNTTPVHIRSSASSANDSNIKTTLRTTGVEVWVRHEDTNGNWHMVLYDGSWGYIYKTSLTFDSQYRAYFMSASEWRDFQDRVNQFREYKGKATIDFSTNGVVGAGYAMEPYQYRAARDAIADMDPPTSPPATPSQYSSITAASILDLATSLNSIT